MPFLCLIDYGITVKYYDKELMIPSLASMDDEGTEFVTSMGSPLQAENLGDRVFVVGGYPFL